MHLLDMQKNRYTLFQNYLHKFVNEIDISSNNVVRYLKKSHN